MAMRNQGERGAVAVEFALILPILVMLLVGIVTTGVSYSNALGATNAVREGTRFGATADSSPSWAADVIARTRATQFDDPGSETKICVQLYKQGAGEVHGSCSAGLSMPTAAQDPKVPAGLTAGTCVVRVLATRPFTINTVLKQWDRVMTRFAVARYERESC